MDIPLVLVSTNSFNDTWEIFFAMFKKYFPEFKGDKYLVTESLDFHFGDVKVIKTSKSSLNENLPWGESIINALQLINAKEIFFVLDDFILTSDVNDEWFNKAYKFFKENDCDFLTLSTHDLKRSHKLNSDTLPFVKVKQFTPYRVTTTPGFWKKETLIKYLTPKINPWQFEILGTIRAFLRNDKFYMLNKRLFNFDNEIFPYYFSNNLDTAIVRGKWQIDACEKFPEFSEKIKRRGIMDVTVIHKPNTFKKVFSNPIFVIRYILGLI